MILDQSFGFNMSSSPSRLPGLRTSLTGKDDSVPSPFQAKPEQYRSQTQISAFGSSDDDVVVITFDKQPSSSAIYEFNGLYLLFIINIY
jgi:hypothetical protein